MSLLTSCFVIGNVVVSVLRLQSYYVFFYVPNILNTFNNKVTAFCFTYYIRDFERFCYVCLRLFSLYSESFMRAYLFNARANLIYAKNRFPPHHHHTTTTPPPHHHTTTPPPLHICRDRQKPAGRPTPRSEAGALRRTIQKKRGFSR